MDVRMYVSRQTVQYKCLSQRGTSTFSPFPSFPLSLALNFLTEHANQARQVNAQVDPHLRFSTPPRSESNPHFLSDF